MNWKKNASAANLMKSITYRSRCKCRYKLHFTQKNVMHQKKIFQSMNPTYDLVIKIKMI